MAELLDFGKAAWSFILFIYKAGWEDSIPINNWSISFRNVVVNKLILKSAKPFIDRFSKNSKSEKVKIAKLPLYIPACLPKKFLERSKFFSKSNKYKKMTNSNIRKLYAQATSSNISDILKLKDNFSNLSAKKIKEIQRIINDKDKVRPQLNITTKGLSKK